MQLGGDHRAPSPRSYFTLECRAVLLSPGERGTYGCGESVRGEKGERRRARTRRSPRQNWTRRGEVPVVLFGIACGANLPVRNSTAFAVGIQSPAIVSAVNAVRTLSLSLSTEGDGHFQSETTFTYAEIMVVIRSHQAEFAPVVARRRRRRRVDGASDQSRVTRRTEARLVTHAV